MQYLPPISAYINSDQKTNQIELFKCEAQIDNYMSTKIFRLSDLCFGLLKEKYKNTAFIVGNGDFIFFATKNAILIKSNTIDHIRIIGGNNTKLSNITSVAVNKTIKSVVLVNDHKNVLVFDLNSNGDIGPIRQLKIDKVVEAESIEINEDDNSIKIFDAGNSLISEFSFKKE